LSFGNYLTFSQVREKIQEHVKIALGIEEFDITFAKREKDIFAGNVLTGKEIWKVNIEFRKKEETFGSSASFSIDAKSGEVLEFQKNMVWKF